MEPSFRSLVRYQEISLEIAGLDARLAAIPAEVSAIDTRQKEAGAVVTEARERHEESLKERRSLEGELQLLEQKVEKYNDQSREVKTNDQYRALMSEIQTVKTAIGEVEEKILLSMERTDELERKIESSEKEISSRKKEFDAARKALAEEKERLASRRGSLDGERERLASSIPSDLMDAYNRVAAIRGDVVMATIHEERCSVCKVTIRPALAAEVRRNEAVRQCESCRRILYFFAEPSAEEPAEGAGQPGTPAAGKGETAGSPPPDPAAS